MMPPWAQKELQSSTFGAEESMVTLMPSLAACRADAAPAMPQPTTRRSVSNAAAGLCVHGEGRINSPHPIQGGQKEERVGVG